MDAEALARLLQEAEALPDDAARQAWFEALPPEAREAVLAQAAAYAEAAFEAASDHLWAAEHVFEPMSRGDTPQEPLPVLHLPLNEEKQREKR